MLQTQTVVPELLELLKKVMSEELFKDYFLVGGTALALQIGHRNSIDIDLFGNCEINQPVFIDKLKKAGVKIEVVKTTNYNTSKLPVKMEYIDEIDIAEAKEIPTFKRMCICIMKNDHLCKYMGFSLTKNEMARRKNIIEKYKSLL